jgi:hypothetical protein
MTGYDAGDIVFAPGDPNVDFLIGAGTWTRPNGFRGIWVMGLAQGGQGGGAVGAVSGQSEGGYGGAGEMFLAFFREDQLNPTEPYACAGQTLAGAGLNGVNGGSTTFKGVTALGGQGGFLSTSTTGNGAGAGGLGGTGGVGGSMHAAGAPGAKGRVLAGQAVLTGCGGSSPLGGGAPSRNAAAAGLPGTGYGSGGGGAFGTTANLAGGAGGPGCLLIRTVY